MDKLNLNRARQIINGFQGKNIAVIGDVMIDKYYWGNVSRVSPEAPVPVIDLKKESFHLGGAANVANNLKSLGVVPYLFGLLGRDDNGKLFLTEAKNNGIKINGLYRDANRKTTVKTRIIGNNQQIARLDNETKDEIDITGIQYIIEQLNDLDNLDAIIFEDYNKGTINKKLIEDVLYLAEMKKINVFVDPKDTNFFEYKNVEVFKPNRKEASNALKIDIKNKEDAYASGIKLKEKLNAKNILLTLGSEGMILIDENNKQYSVPTRARNVADVSGAGDTAIATLAAAYTSGASIAEAASLSNYASGVVCESPGIVSIKIDDLLKSIEKNNVK